MSGRDVLWLWAVAIPFFAVLAIADSCGRRYSTGPDWQRRQRTDIYPNLERDPYEIPEIESPLVTALVLEESSIPTPVQDPDPQVPTSETHYKIYVVRMTLKACSPQDPHDSKYYRRHGFKGAAYNLCADYRVIPKGSRIQLPEGTKYMEESFPGRWWKVDAPIGRWGREWGTDNGLVWVDVKYRTYYSSNKFGTKYVDARVMLPDGYEPGQVFLANVIKVIWLPRE